MQHGGTGAGGGGGSGGGGNPFAGIQFGDWRSYMRNKEAKLQLQQEESAGRAPEGLPQIFQDTVIYINGYTVPPLSDLREMIVQRGGEFRQYLHKSGITHIIAANLTQAKMKEFKNYRVAKPEWIVESVKANKLLSWHQFSTLRVEGSLSRFGSLQNGLPSQSSPFAKAASVPKVQEPGAAVTISTNTESIKAISFPQPLPPPRPPLLALPCSGTSILPPELTTQKYTPHMNTDGDNDDGDQDESIGPAPNAIKENKQYVRERSVGFGDENGDDDDDLDLAPEDLSFVWDEDDVEGRKFIESLEIAVASQPGAQLSSLELMGSRQGQEQKIVKGSDDDEDQAFYDQLDLGHDNDWEATPNPVPTKQQQLLPTFEQQQKAIQPAPVATVVQRYNVYRPDPNAKLDMTGAAHLEVQNGIPMPLPPSRHLNPPGNYSGPPQQEPGTIADPESANNIHPTLVELSNDWFRQNSSVLPGFVEKFYQSSRLHYLSTWKAKLRDLTTEIQKQKAIDDAGLEEATPGLASSSKGPLLLPKAVSLRQQHAQFQQQRQRLEHQSRVVMHIDFDCFFASVAVRDRPDLQNKPIGVAHGSGGSNSNSEIASCNYLARQAGVKNGMHLKSARELCPDIVVVPYEFETYEAISLEFYRILLQYSDELQAVSVDEALLDVTSKVKSVFWEKGSQKLTFKDQASGSGEEKENESGKNRMDPEKFAQMIRDEIFAATKCHASVGMGPNILLAKLSTKRAKPHGQYLWPSNPGSERTMVELQGLYDTELMMANAGGTQTPDLMTPGRHLGMGVSLKESDLTLMQGRGVDDEEEEEANLMNQTMQSDIVPGGGFLKSLASAAANTSTAQPKPSTPKGNSIGMLPGVGRSIQNQLQDRFSITDILGLQQISKGQLQDICGMKTGEMLYQACRGIDHALVTSEKDKARQSVSAEISWGVRFENWDQVDLFMMDLAREVSSRLKEIGRKGKSIVLKIMKRKEWTKGQWKLLGHGPVDLFARTGQFLVYTDDPILIGKEAMKLLKYFKFSPLDLRGLGIQIQKIDNGMTNNIPTSTFAPVTHNLRNQTTLSSTMFAKRVNVSTEIGIQGLNNNKRKAEDELPPLQQPPSRRGSLSVPPLRSPSPPEPLPEMIINRAVYAELPQDIQAELAQHHKLVFLPREPSKEFAMEVDTLPPAQTRLQPSSGTSGLEDQETHERSRLVKGKGRKINPTPDNPTQLSPSLSFVPVLEKYRDMAVDGEMGTANLTASDISGVFFGGNPGAAGRTNNIIGDKNDNRTEAAADTTFDSILATPSRDTIPSWSQLDPAVLMAMPTPIIRKTLKAYAVRDGLLMSPWRQEPTAQHFTEEDKVLPSPSKIDKSVLAALPTEIQAEIEMEYNVMSENQALIQKLTLQDVTSNGRGRAGGDVVESRISAPAFVAPLPIGQTPLGRAKPSIDIGIKKRGRPRKVAAGSSTSVTHGVGNSSRVNTGRHRDTGGQGSSTSVHTSSKVARGRMVPSLDQDFLAALPPDIRAEIEAAHTADMLKQSKLNAAGTQRRSKTTAVAGARGGKGIKQSKRGLKSREKKQQQRKQARRPNLMGKRSVERLRITISEWVESTMTAPADVKEKKEVESCGGDSRGQNPPESNSLIYQENTTAMLNQSVSQHEQAVPVDQGPNPQDVDVFVQFLVDIIRVERDLERVQILMRILRRKIDARQQLLLKGECIDAFNTATKDFVKQDSPGLLSWQGAWDLVWKRVRMLVTELYHGDFVL